VLQDLIGQCSGRQLEQTAGFVARRKPVLHNDFIRSFPRVLSIYLFSFLDPRSLCRCAQVIIDEFCLLTSFQRQNVFQK
jgi:F-box protein 16